MELDATRLQTLLGQLEVSRLFAFDLNRAVAVDLSVNNEAVVGLSGDHRALGAVIQAQVHRGRGSVGMGGYLETRDIYSASPTFGQGGQEPRTVHLGVDIWAPAGTPVYAPLSGVIHSFQDNDGPLDYGGTIIVEHRHEGLEFFTLYGHLSRGSLAGLTRGGSLQRGAPLGALGVVEENGGWPPHLHFQIIADIGSHEGDFPGACRASEVEAWRRRCPDPRLLLRTL